MKVLIVCNDTAYFLRHRRRLADLLAERGHEVTVMAGGPTQGLAFDAAWRFEHLPVERFRLDPVTDAALFLRTFRRLLRDRPDAVQLITLKPAVFGGLAAYLCRRLVSSPERVVVTIPGLGRLMSPGSAMNGRRARLSRYAVERIVRLLASDERFVFTFETAHDRAAWVEKGLLPAGRSVAVAGAGVDRSVFQPAAGHPANRPRRPLKVLFASRLLRSKGLDAFLAAAESLRGRGDVEFLVAGMAEAGDPDSYDTQELEGNGAIRFLGEVDDMAALLRTVDLVCLPTRYGEGIPRILIEAAATGVAAVASSIEGCREIVEDGRTGRLVPPVPPAAAAREVERAVLRYAANRDLLRRHGEAALERFRSGGFAEGEVMNAFMALLSGEAPQECLLPGTTPRPTAE